MIGDNFIVMIYVRLDLGSGDFSDPGGRTISRKSKNGYEWEEVCEKVGGFVID